MFVGIGRMCRHALIVQDRVGRVSDVIKCVEQPAHLFIHIGDGGIVPAQTLALGLGCQLVLRFVGLLFCVEIKQLRLLRIALNS